MSGAFINGHPASAGAASAHSEAVARLSQERDKADGEARFYRLFAIAALFIAGYLILAGRPAPPQKEPVFFVTERLKINRETGEVWRLSTVGQRMVWERVLDKDDLFGDLPNATPNGNQ